MKHKHSVEKRIDTDKYWGEFPESQMNMLLQIGSTKGFDVAKEYVDEVLHRVDFVFGESRSGFLRYLNVGAESVCLDCGCGLGVHTFNMAKSAKEVHSFDQSLKRLQFVSQRKEAENVPNIYLYHSDFKHLPFTTETFDSIIMNGVVEWLGEIYEHKNPRDDQIKVLSQMFSFLKPGGRLYIGIENRWALAYLRGYDHNGIRFTNFFPRFFANIVTKWTKKKSYRTYTYGISGYYKLLKDSGFTREKITFYVAHPGYNLPQYIIAYDDLVGLRFFYQSFSHNKGLKGRIVSFLSRFDVFLRVMRLFVWSYAIIAEK